MFCGGEYETTGMGKGDRAIRGRNGIRPNEQILVGSRARTGERKGSYSASLVALLPYILTFQQNTQNDGSVKGIFVSPSFARIEEDDDAEESHVRERASSSDLLKDEWYTKMFAPELHALKEARSKRLEDDTLKKKTTPTPKITTPTTHASKLEEHQRRVISNFTKNMASGLVRVANEERTDREVAWDLDVRSVRARSARIPIIPVVITQITRISLVSLIHIIRKSLEYQRSNLFTLECYES